jgi:hypothetical protein
MPAYRRPDVSLVNRTRFLATALSVVLVAPPSASGQGRTPWGSAEHIAAIPREELDAITARGRLLAEYDQAAWHATDAVMALRPSAQLVRGYLARRRSDGLWEVVFGRPNARADTFFVAYRAVHRTIGDTTYAASALSPRAEDTEFYARAGRALDVARGEFGAARRPYNAMVVPAGESGDWYVYLVPAPTQPGIFPLGGDARYRISEDGRTLLESRRLHNTILEGAPPPPRAATRVEASYHTHVLSDRPEDTDVFHVLSRTPSVPDYIASQSYYFRIDPDGRITAFDRDPASKGP